jgi:hypothetical protein
LKSVVSGVLKRILLAQLRDRRAKSRADAKPTPCGR